MKFETQQVCRNISHLRFTFLINSCNNPNLFPVLRCAKHSVRLARLIGFLNRQSRGFPSACSSSTSSVAWLVFSKTSFMRGLSPARTNKTCWSPARVIHCQSGGKGRKKIEPTQSVVVYHCIVSFLQTCCRILQQKYSICNHFANKLWSKNHSTDPLHFSADSRSIHHYLQNRLEKVLGKARFPNCPVPFVCEICFQSFISCKLINQVMLVAFLQLLGFDSIKKASMLCVLPLSAVWTMNPYLKTC